MTFLSTVLAVMLGLWLYRQLEDIIFLVNSKKRHKQLLRWEKEAEERISTGKDAEEAKVTLKVVKNMLHDFYRGYERRRNRRDQEL